MSRETGRRSCTMFRRPKEPMLESSRATESLAVRPRRCDSFFLSDQSNGTGHMNDSAAQPVASVRVVEDVSEGSRLDDGFLRLKRLRVANVYPDGTESSPYPCDVVTRRSADAVAICLWESPLDEGQRRGRPRVVLKSGLRVPVFLRQFKDLVRPDATKYLHITELVAGLLEQEDGGSGGLERRARLEASEEAGYDVPSVRVGRLGSGTFASPGVSDEKVYYCSAEVGQLEAGRVEGDGSAMEEGTERVVLDLREAIRRCREGTIPDMKTELGLYRLADALGYIPTLDAYVSELGPEWDRRFDALGVDRSGGPL